MPEVQGSQISEHVEELTKPLEHSVEVPPVHALPAGHGSRVERVARGVVRGAVKLPSADAEFGGQKSSALPHSIAAAEFSGLK